jgi:signal transduction histidine kinase
VLTASDARTALALMRGREVAVLLADQRMPGMTGVELLERVRSEHPEVVRVLITAYSDFHDATAAINRGQVQRFLRKPWVLEDLKASLHEAVELYRTSRRIKALEQRLRETERVYALGVVAAGIAHELRNPITAVATNLSMLREEISGLIRELPPEALNVRSRLAELLMMVSEARTGVQNMTDITRGIELGQRRRDTENEADLAEVVRLTLASVGGELRRRAELFVNLESVAQVRGSRTKLGQVVLNLVVNALQALPARPRSENRISVTLRAHGAFARLDIEDNGCGMSHEERARVFDPFFTTKSDGGTGLGLAISRRILEEVAGTISLTSEPGQGSCFSVYVPLCSSAVRESVA